MDAVRCIAMFCKSFRMRRIKQILRTTELSYSLFSSTVVHCGMGAIFGPLNRSDLCWLFRSKQGFILANLGQVELNSKILLLSFSLNSLNFLMYLNENE